MLKNVTYVSVIILTSFLVGASAPELGQIQFPTSGSPSAQKEFLKGVLYLHSFEYADAKNAFQAAQKLQTDFAMAYWGEAMTYNHPLWMERNRDAAIASLNRLAATPQDRQAKAKTEREKKYLNAVELLYAEGDKQSRDNAYADAMQQLSRQYPDDLEAASFYALALLGTCEYKRDIPTYMKGAAVAEEVFAKNPHHPGAAHYLIHSYDDPVHAPLGLRAARVYAKIAPAAPHALHMPSHIFLALGMWDDVIASNVASWKASNSSSYHALHWLEYAYLQKQRFEDAWKMLVIMKDDAARNNTERTMMHLAYMRAGYLVETLDCKSEAAGITIDASKVEPSAFAADSYASGFCALNNNEINRATQIASGLHDKNDKATADNPQEIVAAKIMEKQLNALIAARQNKPEEALRLASEAAKEEDAMTFDFGPPVPVKPAHELLAELLLQQGKTAEAAKEFEAALAKTPGRRLALAGQKQSGKAS